MTAETQVRGANRQNAQLSNGIRPWEGRAQSSLNAFQWANTNRLNHNPKILGHVRDVEGGVWDVRQIRDTKHGFDLLFGSPQPHLGSYRGGFPQLIATQPLVEYWEANRMKHDGVIFDLPAGRTTLKRMRRRLGFHYFDDVSEFWQERIEDLATLSAREFAARHNMNLDIVFDNRRKLLGNWAREIGWWRRAKPLKILLSNITLREMGEKLDIGTSHAKRLRDRARALVSPAQSGQDESTQSNGHD